MLPASVTSSQAEGRTWTENSQLIQVPAVCSKSANQFIVKVRIPCAFQKDEPTPPQAYSPSLSGYLVLFTHVKPVFFLTRASVSLATRSTHVHSSALLHATSSISAAFSSPVFEQQLVIAPN